MYMHVTGYIPEWRILYIRISNCGHACFTHSANNIESLGRRCVCVCVCVGGGGGGGGGGRSSGTSQPKPLN